MHNTPPSPPDQEALPRILTALTAEEILDGLALASKRGRLPGFVARPPGGGLFAVTAFGHPFDSDLIGEHRPEMGLVFRLAMHRRLPVIFAVILVLTVWPGVYCVDELIAQLLPSLWRPWTTYYWYIPLTILPAPWIWRSVIQRSRRSAREHAMETITKIAAEVGGVVEPSA